MHISGYIPVDLYSFIQFLFTILVILLGLLHLVKHTAKKYFFVDATFDEEVVDEEHKYTQDTTMNFSCASCGTHTNKMCNGCKAFYYCSPICQRKHWKTGHKDRCNDFKKKKLNSTSIFSQKGRVFGSGDTSVAVHQRIKKVLFPYEEFVKLFNWDKQGSPPCGLLNCGNSCFANVVLQCLSCTRPLVAYLLEKGHREQCIRNDWCFMCELQVHVGRAVESSYPFSPINILSRLPNIGGNLGYGKQEDAHEFMRFAIDTMQSVCLDEFGGEKALHPSSLETTLIQHIFGGQLQSQVTCTECNKISNRKENMMDLTVEIQGEASSLEDCLDQFTVKERLDGENLYKCDGCDDYVKAWKRLSVYQAPNILTIALKRFQSGRFGKLNKRVTFPETLDLGPYMSEAGNGSNLYHLYAVVVHVDMLNASFFGHYICYTKDFDGDWYRIDDCKVIRVDLKEVLSQGAYMLLYSRNGARSDCVKPLKVLKEEQGCSEKPDVLSANVESIDLLETSTSKSCDIICEPDENLKSSLEDEDQQAVYLTKEVQDCSDKPLESCSIGESILFETSMSQSCGTKWQPGEDLQLSIEDDQQAVYAAKEVQECSEYSLKSRGITESTDLFETSTSKSFDMLCQPGADSGSTVDPANDMDLEVDCVKADLRSSVNSQQDVNYSTQSNDCMSSLTAETSSASFSNVFVPTKRFPETNSEAGYNIRDGNTEMDGCILEVTSSKCSVGGSLLSENGIYEDYAVPVIENTSTRETLDVDNPASCPRYPNSGLENSEKNPSISLPGSSKKTVEVLEPAGDKNHGVKRNPLFSRGFLDKNNKCRSPNGSGKAKTGSSDVDLSCKINSNSNGFARPGILHRNSTVECNNPNGSNCNLLKSSFIEEKPEKMVLGIVANGSCDGEGNHPSDLMDCEAPPVSATSDMNPSSTEVDCGKADMRSPKNSQQDINYSTESNDCRSSLTAETSSASLSNVFAPAEQCLETSSEAGCNFREGNTEMNGCITEVTSAKCSVGGSLSGENGIYHIEDYADPVTENTSTREAPDVDNPACCPRYQNTSLGNSEKSPSISLPGSSKKIEAKVLEPAGGKDHGVKRKPLFARGFLDKNNRCRSQNGNGKAKVGSTEVGHSCKVKSNSIGFARPDILHRNGTVECNNPNGSNCNLLKSSFIEEKPEKMVLGIVANGGCNGEGNHPSDLMDCEAPPVLSTSDMNSSSTEVDCGGKADLRSPINSRHNINYSTESNDCRRSQTAETPSASLSNVFVPAEQFLDPNSEAGCNFREGNTEMNGCITEATLAKCSVGGSLSGKNGIYHIKDYAVPVTENTSTRENLDMDNPASCERYQNTSLQNSGKSPSISLPGSSKKIEAKVLEPGADKNHGLKRKPLFARGFLEKSNRCRSLNGNGKAKMGSTEVGHSYKVKSNSNGFARPDILHRNGTVECNNPNVSNCNLLKPEKMVLGIVANGGCNGVSYHPTDLMDSEAPPVSATSDMNPSSTEYQDMDCEESSSESDMQWDFGDRNRTSEVVRNTC